MKIRFGTRDNGNSPALLFGFIAFLIGYACCHFQTHHKWTHDLIISSQLSNVTSTIFNLSCGLPYNDYRCSPLSTTPNISNYCLNDAEITSIRVVPLVSFVLQLGVIYELFTLVENRMRFFVHALGIISALTFAVLTVVFYHNSCAQHFTITSLLLTSGILLILLVRDVRAHRERRRDRGNG
jgi:hypothetical protein